MEKLAANLLLPGSDLINLSILSTKSIHFLHGRWREFNRVKFFSGRHQNGLLSSSKNGYIINMMIKDYFVLVGMTLMANRKV